MGGLSGRFRVLRGWKGGSIEMGNQSGWKVFYFQIVKLMYFPSHPRSFSTELPCPSPPCPTPHASPEIRRISPFLSRFMWSDLTYRDISSASDSRTIPT